MVQQRRRRPSHSWGPKADTLRFNFLGRGAHDRCVVRPVAAQVLDDQKVLRAEHMSAVCTYDPDCEAFDSTGMLYSKV